MKKSITHIIIIAFSLLSATHLRAQVIVETGLNHAEILIGDQVTLTTTVSVGKGQTVKFPDYVSGDTLVRGIEIIKCGNIDTISLNDGKRAQFKRDYILTSFDSALYMLPPMEVSIDGKPYLSRSRLGLKVNSVAVDTVHVDQFNPPYDIVKPPYVWNNVLLWKTVSTWFVFLLLSGTAIRLSKKKPITRKITIKPPTPPYKKACQDMENIRNTDMNGDENDKIFFIRLTETIRSYLHARFGFNALEKTTAEITAGTADLMADSEICKLKDIFGMADFVKFAKQRTTLAERKHCMDLSMAFLSNTKDETMENPRPITRIVTLDERKQQLIRIGLWLTFVVGSLTSLAWTAWNIWEIHDTYL